MNCEAPERVEHFWTRCSSIKCQPLQAENEICIVQNIIKLMNSYGGTHQSNFSRNVKLRICENGAPFEGSGLQTRSGASQCCISPRFRRRSFQVSKRPHLLAFPDRRQWKQYACTKRPGSTNLILICKILSSLQEARVVHRVSS